MNQKLVHITNQSLLRYAYVYTMTAFTVSTISYRNQDKTQLHYDRLCGRPVCG